MSRPIVVTACMAQSSESGRPTATMAPRCRWRSRPQHQKSTSEHGPAVGAGVLGPPRSLPPPSFSHRQMDLSILTEPRKEPGNDKPKESLLVPCYLAVTFAVFVRFGDFLRPR